MYTGKRILLVILYFILLFFFFFKASPNCVIINFDVLDESLMWRARLDDDSTLFNKATKYQMKSCEEYQTLMKQKYK